MCDQENEVSYDELLELGVDIQDKIQELDTLEIYAANCGGPLHLAFKTEKSGDIQSLMKYCNYKENDEYQDVYKLNATYKGNNFSFNRVINNTDYNSFILISKESIQGEKKGMIVIADPSNVIFVATGKVGILGKLNLDLVACIYPDM